jgi:adenylosuccinate lyase
MDFSHAISPIDGRYFETSKVLSPYFSEFALFRYRILVEVEYLIFLSHLKPLVEVKEFTKKEEEFLRSLYFEFSDEAYAHIKEIELITNHDVKSVEYYLKEQLHKCKLDDVREMVHFGLTSQDINNTSIALSLQDALGIVIIPNIYEILTFIRNFANTWADTPMLSRTHGQSASPTTVGKEFAVYAKRLERQLERLQMIKVYGKFSGATGNYHTHSIAYPNIDWPPTIQKFFNLLKLDLNPVTTQIEPYDCIAEVCDNVKRINTILLDLSQDMWHYISQNYFKLKLKEGEIGSSTMPHKVNPIDFENAEGNLGMANAIFMHLSSKLPISRLQRDLSDSTVIRNLGLPFAHSMVAYAALLKGFMKIEVNKKVIIADLNNHPEVLAEAIQTIMRKCGIEKPYEKMKEITRGKEPTLEDLQNFIKNLDIPDDEKQKLLNLTPETYIGIADKLAKSA